jgi:gamma-tubulin complex component 5
VSAASTPLLLKLELETRFGAIFDCLEELVSLVNNPTSLLNTLHAMLSMPNAISTQNFLLDLFIASATPQWRMINDLLNRGMPIPISFTSPDDVGISGPGWDEEGRQLEAEFIITRDRDVSWADEDFWEAGFIINPGGEPVWMDEETLELVLEAGKARGLIKSLSSDLIKQEEWLDLKTVLANCPPTEISTRIANYLTPSCQITTFHLRRILEEECGLYEHLEAIEGLLYMRGSIAMSEWTDNLFKRMKNGGKWADFQGLTSSLREAVEETGERWMNGPAIRLTYARHAKGLPGIRAHYQVGQNQRPVADYNRFPSRFHSYSRRLPLNYDHKSSPFYTSFIMPGDNLGT